MANRHLNWAFLQALKPGPKLVLLCLSNRANKEDQCWPTLATLQAETGLSRRAVIENTSKLLKSGLIQKEQRGPVADLFTLLIDGKGVQKTHLKGVQKQHGKTTKGVQKTQEGVQIPHKRGAENDIPPTPPYKEEPKRTHINPKVAKPKKPVQPQIVLPDWLPPELWADFKGFRRHKDGKALSPMAEKRALSKLSGLQAKGNDPKTMIDATIEKNWATFYPGKGGGNRGHGFSEPATNFDNVRTDLEPDWTKDDPF